jgi:hypothetical protein
MAWVGIGDSPLARGATVVSLAIVALWVYATWDDAPRPDANDATAATLQVAASLDGVRLGDTLASATAAHGPFDRQAPRPEVVKKYADEEDYVQRNGQLRVSVRGGVIHTVGYACREGRDGTVLNRVACHDFEDRVRKVFGELRVLCAKVRADDPKRALAPHVRAYDAIPYGTRHIIIKDAVAGFIVMEPAELQSLVGFNWEECP